MMTFVQITKDNNKKNIFRPFRNSLQDACEALQKKHLLFVGKNTLDLFQDLLE